MNSALPIESAPLFRKGTRAETLTLALQLSMPFLAETLADASDSEDLRFAEIGPTKVWGLFEPSRIACVRWLSGAELRDRQGRPTCEQIFGDVSWPIGAGQVFEDKPVLIVRGLKEALAGRVEFWGYVILAMVSDRPMPDEVLPKFTGRLVALGDFDAGADFAIWRRQLASVARNVHTIQMSPHSTSLYHHLAQTTVRSDN